MSINLKRISRWCNFSRFRFVRRRQTFLLVCYKLIWQVVNFFFILTTMQFTDTGMSIALWKSIKLLILLVLKTYPTHELVRCSDEGGGIAFSLILIRRKSHSFFFVLFLHSWIHDISIFSPLFCCLARREWRIITIYFGKQKLTIINCFVLFTVDELLLSTALEETRQRFYFTFFFFSYLLLFLFITILQMVNCACIVDFLGAFCCVKGEKKYERRKGEGTLYTEQYGVQVKDIWNLMLVSSIDD